MKNLHKLDEIMKRSGRDSKKQVSSHTIDCLSSPQIIGFIDRALDDTEAQKVERHLANCNYCLLKLTDVFRAMAKRREVINIDWQQLKRAELRSLLEESIDRSRSAALDLPTKPAQYAIAADGARELMVSVFEEDGREKQVPFVVENGPEIDNEGQLVFAISAPDESYEGKLVDLELRIDDDRTLILASPPIFNGVAIIMLDMGLEAELEISLEMIRASIGRKD